MSRVIKVTPFEVRLYALLAPVVLAAQHPSIELTQRELDALPEYSCSNPTGAVVGKRWKCNVNAYGGAPGAFDAWLLREYAEHENPRLVRIVTHRIIVKDRIVP
jgi:hypothetical protein